MCELVQQVLTPISQEHSLLHNTVDHVLLIRGTVLGCIPVSAWDTPRFPWHLGSHLLNEPCSPPHNGHRPVLLRKIHLHDTSSMRCLLQLIMY